MRASDTARSCSLVVLDQRTSEIHVTRNAAAFVCMGRWRQRAAKSVLLIAVGLLVGAATPAFASAGVRLPGQGSGTPVCVDAGVAAAHYGFAAVTARGGFTGGRLDALHPITTQDSARTTGFEPPISGILYA